MTITAINSTASRVEYTATASQTVFSYPFPIFAESELGVYQSSSGDPELSDKLTLTTHYTISGEAEDAGGNVTLVTGATAGDTVVIVHEMPLSRSQQFTDGGPFEAVDLEAQLNELTAQIKQINSTKVDRYQESTPQIDGRLKVSAAVADDEAVNKAQLDTFAFGEVTTDVPVVPTRTLYVATDGDDSNAGTSSGAAFLTLQAAIDVVS